MKLRETQLDILRLAAFAGVIFTHAREGSFGTLPSLLAAVVTWHVPVFVMLSGRFFLDPERPCPPRKLLRAIARLGTAWLFWNTLYQLYYLLTGMYAGLNRNGLLVQWLLGTYHLWFLPMLMCLYAAVPLLRRLAEGKRRTEIYLLLFLLFGFLAQEKGRTVFSIALGFSGYFVLGDYLRRHPLTDRREAALYTAGILCMILTGTAALRSGPGEEWFCRYLMPNVILEAAAICTLFSRRVPGFPSRRITVLAQCSFGGYLVHPFVLAWLDPIPLPLRVMLTFVLSLAIAGILRKIPRLGKWIA